MKISTRGRYAIRLMLDLAQSGGDHYVTIKSISERQDISSKYLEQIISILNRAGYVKSVRGSQGGYKLARPPEEYTVGMILRLIEGSLVPVSCMDDEPNQCPHCETCVTLDVWKQIDEAVSGVVDNITLADLAKKESLKNASAPAAPEYHI
ncbi:transcriptional regulator, BadM/Rrf2 family [Sporobacter termitidis DSM 10068]|uniref:Transcriptional regulator, BadM/Rrf2 family n=1 Tax=Sporobacter termitidis DSM 10068 TaxID=1123282 RepID=A0A1M5Z1F5_9FIRM|nr:Rrf2 family transcriptional regulator [Sporobacter termitidis]SHI18105.1 transcriptional regulator, BadM/Rrf2 family [Sporobacter termitidis DSM 10068]